MVNFTRWGLRGGDGIPTTGTWSSPTQIGTASNWTQIATTGGNYGVNYYGFTAVNAANELWGAGNNLSMSTFHKIGDGFLFPLMSGYQGLVGSVGVGLKTDGLYYVSSGSLSSIGTFTKINYAGAGIPETPTFNPGILPFAFQKSLNAASPTAFALIP